MPSLFDRLSAAWSAFAGGGSVAASAGPADEKRGPSLAKLAVTGAGPSPRVDKSPLVLGPNVTPQIIAAALRDAERGRMRRLCDLCSEMRETVPTLQAELGKREKAISRCEVSVIPAQVTGLGRNAAKKAAKIADFVHARVDAIEDLSDSIEHLSGGIYYGRSGCEKEYFRDKHGIGIRRLAPVAPKRFSYAANWRVHLWDEAGNERDPRLGTFPGVDIREEWPDKFVIHEPRTLGAEIPTRQGLGRVLVWAAMFWKADARFWMEFAELFANPWRVGYYPKGTDGADIEVLKQGLIELSGLTTAVFAEGCQPYFLQPNDTRTHAELHTVWTAEISKVVNGGTLTSSMNGASGSRAAGEVHEREAYKLTAGDGMSMDATLTRDVSRSLVRLNFGDEAAQLFTPRIHLGTEQPENVEKRASRIWAYVDRGGEVDADEVRDQLTGLSKPKKGARLLLPLAAVKPAAEAAVADSGDAAGAEKPEDEEPADAPDGADADPDEIAESEEDDGAEDA